MPTTLEQPDIFQRIGKSFGEGAGGQIERGMLARGLEKLSKGKEIVNPETKEKTYQPYSQIELLSQGYRLPGFAENANTFLPALQNSAYLENRRKQAAGEGGLPTTPDAKASVSQAPIGAQPQIEASPKSKEAPIQIAPGRRGEGFSTPEERQAKKTTLLRQPSIQERAQKEIELSQSGIMDPKVLQEEAEKALLGPGNAIRENETSFENRLKERRAALGVDLPPGIRDAFREEGLHRVRREVPPDKAADEIISMEEDVAKAITKIGQTAGSWYKPGSWGQPGAKFTAYKEQEKVFDKYGLREQFLDLVKKKQGLTFIQAAQDFDPLQNDKIKKAVKSLPGISASAAQRIRDIPPKTLDSILSDIRPEDNILSIAGELRDKNYSVPQFLEAAGEKKGLTDEQRRQLQNPETNSIFGDIFWRSFR